MNQIAITRNTHIHSYKSSVDKHMAYAEQTLVQFKGSRLQVHEHLYLDKGENNWE